ncbi:HNH endonuclease [Luteococcus japonicus LSP_Lj1]|uniref:HNH endonuclease n=2 Tax=Luteococcus japonicus TaxID=33984 RepID=A0A1R4JKE7_9ACTN|nr:HNH endonuclease [Luteococcus japonicus LSP_Lj1]
MTSAQTVDVMLSARRRAWMAEAEEFELAAHFADPHPGEAVEQQQQQPAGSAVVLFGEKSVRLGYDGTPEVAEFASLEIAAALNIIREAADCLIGDALSLRHRLPLLWQKMRDGFLRVGVAWTLVAKTASLPLQQALQLDRELAPLVEGVSSYRLVATAEGLVLELTPAEQAQDDYERAQASRGVWIGQSGFGVSDGSKRPAQACDLDHTEP